MILKKSINRELVSVIVLIVLTLGIVFFKFNQIPKNLAFDEVEFTKLALSLKNKPYIPYSPLATGHSTLYFYILLFFFKIFGVNSFALRLPAAIFGVLSVLIFYLIAKIIFIQPTTLSTSKTKYLPFLLTIIFLTSRWYFNFSRFAFEATFLLFLELAAVYFLLQCFNPPAGRAGTLKWPYFLLTGLFTGLAFNSYTPGRIFFILIFTAMLLKLGLKKNTFKPFIICLSSFLIVILPLSLYLITHQDIRFNQQFFLKNNQLTVNKKAEFVWKNIQSTTLMFNFRGDINGRHNYPNKPALNLIIGGLFLFGLLLALIDLKKNFYNQFFILYFILSLIPTLLTYPWENPNMLRTFTVIPAVVYFCGLTINFILNRFNKFKPALLLMFILVVASSFYEIRTYYKYQVSVFKEAFEVEFPLEKAIKTEKIL